METWNRNEKWELHRTFHERGRVHVTICEDKRVSQMATLRSIVPSLRSLTPMQLRDLIDDNGVITLEEMEGRLARSIYDKLVAEGVEARQVDASFVSFLPMNRSRSMAWLIEDPEESERVTQEMIFEGVPVIETEA